MAKKERCNHKWMLVGRKWHEPFLRKRYKCKKCGKTFTVEEFYGPSPPEEIKDKSSIKLNEKE